MSRTTRQATWWVYIVRCADQTLYTGITTDVERRLRMHNGGILGGAKYTRARRPVTLVFSEKVYSNSAAIRRENAIKSMTRDQKEQLIAAKEK